MQLSQLRLKNTAIPLQRRKTPPNNESSEYDKKGSDRGALVLELWEV